MFSTTWKTSERKFNVIVARDVRIPISDGIEISADIFRPDSGGRFPAILGMHCYAQEPQTAPIKPSSNSTGTFMNPLEEKRRGWLEAGDPNFFVRRGYVHVIANVRGTGKSGGNYQWLGQREIQDVYEVIEWIAKQEWCSGNVGMFGVSYFAVIQLLVAGISPPSLKCLFAPWGLTDYYRDNYYHGGILRYERAIVWPRGINNLRLESLIEKQLGDQKFREAINEALQDGDIAAVPRLVEILKNPGEGLNSFVVYIILNAFDGHFWNERK